MRVISRNSLGAPDATMVAARLNRSARLHERYLAAGGSLAPHFDPSDPMHEIYLADEIYELTTIPDDLVSENVDFESLIKTLQGCGSLEAAQLEIEKFRRNCHLAGQIKTP